MRASQLPALTGVLLTAATFAALSWIGPWGRFEDTRVAWLNWGSESPQQTPGFIRAAGAFLACLLGGWLGGSMSLRPSVTPRVALQFLFALLLLTFSGSLSLIGIGAEPFTAMIGATVCWVIAWGLNRARQLRLHRLENLGLTNRVSQRRIHAWLDSKKPLVFPESTVVASLATITFDEESNSTMPAVALAFLIENGGCLESVSNHHVQVWFGFPHENARPGRKACRTVRRWRDTLPESCVWQAAVVTGSIEITRLADGQGSRLEAVGPWAPFGRTASAELKKKIVLDAATHEMLDDGSWSFRPLDVSPIAADDVTLWYELTTPKT